MISKHHFCKLSRPIDDESHQSMQTDNRSESNNCCWTGFPVIGNLVYWLFTRLIMLSSVDSMVQNTVRTRCTHRYRSIMWYRPYGSIIFQFHVPLNSDNSNAMTCIGRRIIRAKFIFIINIIIVVDFHDLPERNLISYSTRSDQYRKV